MSDKICSVDGCDNNAKSLGMCSSHYARFHRYGDPLMGGGYRKHLPKGTKCSVDGCNCVSKNKGYCNKHYLRFIRHGDPLAGSYPKNKLRAEHESEYTIWKSMRQRCNDKNCKNYKKYGGRGIKVCDRWMDKWNGFANFYSDMGDKPENKSLDRIDNDGDYSPENCKWATPLEQAQHTRQCGIYSDKKGVTYNKILGYWVSFIHKDGKYYAKYSKTEYEAIKKRNDMEHEYGLC